MAEHESIDAPDTDQIPVQTAPQPAARSAAGPHRTPAPGNTIEGVPGGRAPDGSAPDSPAPDSPAPDSPGPDPRPVEPSAPTGAQHYRRLRRTRFSGLWVGVTVAAVVLLVLLVFIIENSQAVNVSFFGAHWQLSLGVAMLLAAICGVLLVAIPGYGRIFQLRRAFKRTTASLDKPPRG